MSINWRVSFALLVAGLAIPSSAAAHSAAAGTGGAGIPDDPEVAAAVCEDATAWACARGAKLTLEGEALDQVRQVRFLGGRGTRDDRVAKPRSVDPHRVDVQVPRGARSGRIALTGRRGAKALTSQKVRIRARAARSVAPTTAPAPAPAGDGVFPIRGEHTYGTEVNTFGGGRDHKGHDVFAKCGTPLVALYDAKVQFVGTQSSAAGNYIVLQAADGQSYAYMHMQGRAAAAKGDVVRAGQQVGRVGDTGRASGCHLHFEQWTAPGWYEGGEAIDPLPLLKSLDQ